MTKSGTHFRFKQFAVQHDRCTMKVGTDGVLLGAWTDVRRAGFILDIGTGSGVIALMLAQRSAPDTIIDAVELSAMDAQQARENIMASPWPDKITVHQTSIQEFSPERKYDCIVSNPPYFINSQEPPDHRRLQTRHTVTLSFDELLKAVSRLLSPSGTFSVILPFTEGNHFATLAQSYNLQGTRRWSFRTRKEKPIERWLLEFAYQPSPLQESEILLYERGDQWSDTYLHFTGEFYLGKPAVSSRN